jgi:crotonobetainyl-CoA:carnitine CoA-transferase CaiB-like acyl-CoA transferase
MNEKTPLQGLKVLELASVLAGPSVGMFFAELGATVYKIENVTTQGDVTRKWKLPKEDPDTDISGYFSCVNWGKYSFAVDLCQEEGLNIIYELAAQCDIVLVSYKPGDAEKLKVDYPTLKKYIVLISSTPTLPDTDWIIPVPGLMPLYRRKAGFHIYEWSSLTDLPPKCL